MACCWSFWGRRRLRARDVELTRVGPLGRGGPGVDLPSSASPSSLSCITCLLCRLVLLGLFVGQQHRAGWTRSGETRRGSREARGRGELAEPQDGSRLCRGQGAGSQHHIRRKQIRSTFKPRGKFLLAVAILRGVFLGFLRRTHSFVCACLRRAIAAQQTISPRTSGHGCRLSVAAISCQVSRPHRNLDYDPFD